MSPGGLVVSPRGLVSPGGLVVSSKGVFMEAPLTESGIALCPQDRALVWKHLSRPFSNVISPRFSLPSFSPHTLNYSMMMKPLGRCQDVYVQPSKLSQLHNWQ